MHGYITTATDDGLDCDGHELVICYCQKYSISRYVSTNCMGSTADPHKGIVFFRSSNNNVYILQIILYYSKTNTIAI